MKKPNVIDLTTLAEIIQTASPYEMKVSAALLNHARELKLSGRGLPGLHCSRNDHVSLAELAKAIGAQPNSLRRPIVTAIIFHLIASVGIERRQPRWSCKKFASRAAKPVI